MLALVSSSFAATGRAETLDRIAVTIGNHVIALSQILKDLRIVAFIDAKPPDFSAPQMRAAADRLIDQYLLLQEAAMTRTPLPTAADIEPVLNPIKERFASEADFKSALERAGITEAELRDHLLAGLQLLRYTDLRFVPEVQVTDQNIRDYYDDFIAKHPQQPNAPSGPLPTFEESRDQMEKLLTEERVLQALDRWLGMTRSETEILYRDAALR